ncbi:MAG: 1,4-alpha-glucan branching protein domain-containing protein [Candidatus Omnitrophota bacterium]|jgi:1,4-alpha-glucan branching enzyme
MHKGYLCLVLHSHLPFVRHPEHDDFLEEDWLYEAITETYLPLLWVFEKLVEDKIDFRVTMSLTPTLISMLSDPLLQERYLKHINKLIELSHKEIERTAWQQQFQNLAIMYLNNFCRARDTFERYKRNIVTAFKNLQDLGKLEIITCGATHGYFPLMDACRDSVKAQVRVAVSHYESVFGRKPRGIWLPECGYQPGHDEILKESGIKYFFTDSHGVLHGTPRPKYGVFAPVYCKNTGVACFARDLESSKQVWSSVEGYPGDYNYREFYRDIGFDLEYDYIKPYISPDGVRINTGIKYYRITGTSMLKEPYMPQWAADRAAEHAGNFMFNRQKQVEYLNDFIQKKPIIVSPYDAELYGHWWYEGPMWLDFLIRKIACDQKTIKLITPSEYLAEHPRNQVITPSMSSWGWKGYSEMWLQGPNDWLYRHMNAASERMSELSRSYPNVFGITKRALNQALRELLLAQSSDWAFIMGTGTHTSYAVRRTKDHLLRFSRLYEDIKSNSIDEEWLSDVESKDNLFSDIDYRVHQ